MYLTSYTYVHIPPHHITSHHIRKDFFLKKNKNDAAKKCKGKKRKNGKSQRQKLLRAPTRGVD